MTATRYFTNPFELAHKSKLYNLVSGAPVPPDVEIDVMQAEIKGQNKKDEFIWISLTSGRSADLFVEPIPRLKLNTMAACNKTAKLTTSDGKIIQYKEQSDLAFMLLINSQVLV